MSVSDDVGVGVRDLITQRLVSASEIYYLDNIVINIQRLIGIDIKSYES